MKPVALFYNFSEERFRKARFFLIPLKITARAVPQKDFNQPIGFLAGIKEIEPCGEPFDGNGFSDEMIVMHNFTNNTVESLIKALIKCGIGRVPLKAVITSSNKEWNGVQLCSAIKADHLEMTKKK